MDFGTCMSCLMPSSLILTSQHNFKALRQPLTIATRRKPEEWNGTSCFKSGDGHSNCWQFSYARLNLEVARLAGRQGGCLVVDSTRRGKLFPDSFTATVPIWCAVLNSLLAKRRKQEGIPWDCDLHVPPWLSQSERSQIAARIPGWVAGFGTAAAEELEKELAGYLKKPLRPAWVAPGWCGCPKEWDGESILEDFCPIVCISASHVISSEAHREHYSWEYIQGAGDDEESWAQSLTPSMFWAQAQEFIACSSPEAAREMAEAAVNRASVPAAAGQGHGIAKIGATLLSLGVANAEGLKAAQNQGVRAVLNCSLGDAAQESLELDTSVPYLNLVLKKGKRPGEHIAEELIPAGLEFVLQHAASGAACCIVGDPSTGVSVMMAVAALVALWPTGLCPSPSVRSIEDSVNKDVIRAKHMQVQRFCREAHLQLPRSLRKQLNNFFIPSR
ncbi:unnamed protein product [Chrysoparadoxa australica]